MYYKKYFLTFIHSKTQHHKKLIFLSLFSAALFVNAQDSFVGICHLKDNNSTYKFRMDRINETDYKVVYSTLKCSSIWKLKKIESDLLFIKKNNPRLG